MKASISQKSVRVGLSQENYRDCQTSTVSITVTPDPALPAQQDELQQLLLRQAQDALDRQLGRKSQTDPLPHAHESDAADQRDPDL